MCVQCPRQTDNTGTLAAYIVGLLIVISAVIANTIASAHATSFADAERAATFFSKTNEHFSASFMSNRSSRSRGQSVASTRFWGEDTARMVRSERLTSLAALKALQLKHGSVSGREVNLKLVGTAMVNLGYPNPTLMNLVLTITEPQRYDPIMANQRQVKLIITYCQLLSFMSDLRITWPPIIVAVFETAGKYTAPSLQMASVDCAIQAGSSGMSPYIGRLVALAVMPVLTVLCAGLIWLIVWAVWNTRQYRTFSTWWDNKQTNWRLAAKNKKDLQRAARGERANFSAAEAAGSAAESVTMLSAKELRSRAKTNFLITAMALLFLQHSAVSKAAFTFFSCRYLRSSHHCGVYTSRSSPSEPPPPCLPLLFYHPVLQKICFC